MRSPVGTTDGKYVRRAVDGRGRPACVPFMFHEMQAHQADRGALDYSALRLPGVRWEDLDPLEIERFRRMVRESRGRSDESLLALSDVELAKALGAVEADHDVRAVRVLGLLLFGREDVLRRALPTHEVAFQALAGVDVEANDFFRWPLLRSMEELEQLRNGRPAPSYDRTTEATVVVVLPGGAANLEFARIVFEEAQAGRPLALDDLLILNEIWIERRLTTANAARLIQKPETDARTRLARLTEVGLIEARGSGPGRVYHLSSTVYRRLGDKAGYVRQRGFDAVQHEQMVLQYAQAHGRITRAEAAELCQLTSVQAKNLLKRLTQQGKLSMASSRRTAYYEPATKVADRAEVRRRRS